MGPSPILWNQSRLPKELPGSLNLLVLLLSRQSARSTLPPSLSFVVISSEAKEGLFLSLPVSPPSYLPFPPLQSAVHAGRGAFIKLHTQKQLNGLLKPVILNRVFVFCETTKRFSKRRNKRKKCSDGLSVTTVVQSERNWATLHKSGLYS